MIWCWIHWEDTYIFIWKYFVFSAILSWILWMWPFLIPFKSLLPIVHLYFCRFSLFWSEYLSTYLARTLTSLVSNPSLTPSFSLHDKCVTYSHIIFPLEVFNRHYNIERNFIKKCTFLLGRLEIFILTFLIILLIIFISYCNYCWILKWGRIIWINWNYSDTITRSFR